MSEQIRPAWARKKWILALLCWVAGSTLAFMTKTSLGEYTAFTTVLLAAFGTADVLDKKHNGRG